MLLRRIALAFLLCALTAPVQPALARSLALLVGVSDYELASIENLKAPGNDVRLVLDLLLERGGAGEDIVVLADDLAPGREASVVRQPTAENILKELDGLADKAGEGDLVVVYLSGHGSSLEVRQDIRVAGDYIEADRWHEAFLAIDAQAYDADSNEIEGAILDKTLKGKLDAVTSKGAFVWLIVDACHAAGLTRDPEIGVSVRFVSGEDLRLPSPASPRAPPGLGTGRASPWINRRAGGRQVAFLAAPEENPAYEREVGEAGGKHYGIFTYALVKALKAENFSTYRQLARALVRAPPAVSGSLPSPVFEGDLDRPMFDGSQDGRRRWLASADAQTGEVRVAAGALHGVRAGAILRFERGKRVLGYGRVEKAAVSASRARLIELNGRPPPPPASVDGAVATVVEPSVSFTLKVALPPPRDRTGHGDVRMALEAMDRLIAEARPSLPMEWVEPRSGDADIHLRILGGVIYLVPATGELVRSGRHRTPAVSIARTATPDGGVEATANRLRTNLWRVLRRQNLLRIANEMGDEELAGAVDVSLGLIRDRDELERLAADEEQACRSWDRAPNTIRPVPIGLDRGGHVRLTHCDRLAIEIANRWHKAVDVTLLYMDGEGGIGLLPTGEVRIPPNQAQFPQEFDPVRIVTWCDRKVWRACEAFARSGYQPVGKEHLVVILAEATGKDLRTFPFLRQDSLAKAEEAAKERGGGYFEALLSNASLVEERTRGVARIGDATIRLYPLEVVVPGRLLGRQ